MDSLTSRLAGYLNGDGSAYIAVYRTGDKGQCVHLAHKDAGRGPTLCGIDRTYNGGGVEIYGRSQRKYFNKGAWMKISTWSFEGRFYLGNLLSWRPADRHLCRACLHSLPRKEQ